MLLTQKPKQRETARASAASLLAKCTELVAETRLLTAPSLRESTVPPKTLVELLHNVAKNLRGGALKPILDRGLLRFVHPDTIVLGATRP